MDRKALSSSFPLLYFYPDIAGLAKLFRKSRAVLLLYKVPQLPERFLVAVERLDYVFAVQDTDIPPHVRVAPRDTGEVLEPPPGIGYGAFTAVHPDKRRNERVRRDVREVAHQREYPVVLVRVHTLDDGAGLLPQVRNGLKGGKVGVLCWGYYTACAFVELEVGGLRAGAFAPGYRVRGNVPGLKVEYLFEALDSYQESLWRLRDLIEKKDGAALAEEFGKARDVRIKIK